jgi:hypothetical protein
VPYFFLGPAFLLVYLHNYRQNMIVYVAIRLLK